MKKHRWMIPTLWRNDKKLKFVDYRINKEGTIKRKRDSINRRYKSGRCVKAFVDHKGYIGIHLTFSKEKRYTSIKLHRLLWETFVGKIPDGYEINHKDGIKNNNRLKNLEAVTHRENMKHAIRNKLWQTGDQIKKVSGENHPSAILTYDKVEKIRFLHYISGWFQKELAKRFDCSVSAINHILQGYTWNPNKLSKKELIHEVEKTCKI